MPMMRLRRSIRGYTPTRWWCASWVLEIHAMVHAMVHARMELWVCVTSWLRRFLGTERS